MAIDPTFTREDLERQKFDLAGDGAVRVTITGGSSSGTEYTEDAAAAANPAGGALMLIRKDTPSAEVSADGDNVALRGSNYGAAYVTLLDTAGAPLAVGGGTQYTEDAAAAANPIGNVPILVRADTPAASVSAAGDNIAQRGTDYGAAYVQLVTSAGAFIDSVGGGTQYTEDAAAAANPVGTALIGVRADALAGVTSADGDNVAVRMTDKGEMYVKHADSIAVTSATFGTAANQTTIIGHLDGVEGLLTTIDADTGGIATSVASIDTKTPALGQALAAASVPVVLTAAQITTLTPPAAITGFGTAANQTTIIGHLDGVEGLLTTIDADTGTLAGAVAGTEMQVDIVAALPAGTNAIGKLAANSGVDIGDVDVASLTGGTIAHDAADSGNPIKVGARATNVEIAAVANNDRSDLVTTLTGKLITHPYTNPENIVSGAITTAMTGTTSTSLVAAPAAGLRNYITTIIVSNSHATVGTDIIIQDGSGGTTLLTIPAAAVYGGAAITLPVPLRQPTTATAIFCANVTTGASTKVSAVGYKAA